MNKREYEIIQTISKLKRKSPYQVNHTYETDTELIRVNNNILTATVDSLTEELKGLFKDPFTIGWLSVLTSLSDTAASGASPLGVLLARLHCCNSRGLAGHGPAGRSAEKAQAGGRSRLTHTGGPMVSAAVGSVRPSVASLNGLALLILHPAVLLTSRQVRCSLPSFSTSVKAPERLLCRR
jgi:hypothetical protein